MRVDQVKANGVHYTPPDLAQFLAEVVVHRLSFGVRSLEILDPACGDGAFCWRSHKRSRPGCAGD